MARRSCTFHLVPDEIWSTLGQPTRGESHPAHGPRRAPGGASPDDRPDGLPGRRPPGTVLQPVLQRAVPGARALNGTTRPARVGHDPAHRGLMLDEQLIVFGATHQRVEEIRGVESAVTTKALQSLAGIRPDANSRGCSHMWLLLCTKAYTYAPTLAHTDRDYLQLGIRPVCVDCRQGVRRQRALRRLRLARSCGAFSDGGYGCDRGRARARSASVRPAPPARP